MSLPIERTHRTALVIIDKSNTDPDPDTNTGFANRVSRLLESVNGDNIKVDVGVTNVDVNVANWAADKGYTMLLVATRIGD